MIQNLEDRGCMLPGIEHCPSEEAQIARLHKYLGSDCFAECMTMNKLYRDRLDHSAVDKLEIFDEYEEWEIMQGHYCLVLGARGAANTEELHL